VSQAKKQHKLAISLLKELGMDYIQLKRQGNGHYHYYGWTTPLVDGNGTPKISRCGTVRLKPVH
jgi:hypothetical protein